MPRRSPGPAAPPQLLQHVVVVARVDGHEDVAEVLGRRADEGHAADVDLLHSRAQVDGRGAHRLHKGVEVDHDHVDRHDALRREILHVGRPGPVRQDTGMDSRVEGFDAPLQHLGKTSDVGHGACRHTPPL